MPQRIRFGNHDRDRHRQPWEIDFAKNTGVRIECLGRFHDAISKVAPRGHAGEVKQDLGQAIGRELSDIAENKRESKGGEQGLDDEPKRPQNSLLVLRNEITTDEQHD